MKLLNVRFLKVYSSKSINSVGLLGFHRNFITYYSPLNLKCVRNCYTMTRYRRSVDTFRYEYDTDELLEKLRSSTNNTVISSVDNNVKIEAILRNSRAQNLESNEAVQAIVASLILAAKSGQNVVDIIEKTFGANELTKFFALLDTWLDQMNPDDAVSTLIALKLLHVPLHHPANRKLTTHVTRMLRGMIVQ